MMKKKTEKIVLLSVVLMATIFGLYLVLKKPAPEPEPVAEREDRLIRHLTVSDFDAYKIGVAEIQPADAIVYNQWFHDAEIESLAVQDVEGWRYYNALNPPLPEWVGGGNPWFDWADSVIVKSWGAVIKDASGTPAHFSAFGNPLIFDWSELRGERSDLIISKQLELLTPCQTIFLDQFYLEPSDWMFHASGPGMEVVTDADRQVWRHTILAYLDKLRQKLAIQGGGLVIVNGERTSPPPVFLENSHDHPQETWDQSVKRWLEHPQNALSVDNIWPWPESLLAVYKIHGGAMSLAGGLVETQGFYEKAHKLRPDVPPISTPPPSPIGTPTPPDTSASDTLKPPSPILTP